MKAISLHRDVILVTSQLLHANCTIVRAPSAAEVFVIDSPVLPEELELLGSLLAQAGFPAPSGLLATHADWDHLLAPIAFPEAALGCAERSAERLRSRPGDAQRELRAFDERMYIERPRPLRLGAVQALVVPGRCAIGEQELELLPAQGHTSDGMAVWIGWAQVLVAGDYLSPIEIPTLSHGDLDSYVATLERLRPFASEAAHVVPGHGPALDREQALGVLEQDVAYLNALRDRGGGAELPPQRRSAWQRELHAQNLAALGA